MLTSSTLSRVSQVSNSVSYSENVDLDIVDRIVGKARDATTFPEVYKAYVEVLEDHGVSPAKDAAYYQFLLKLGIVRATTWGERWAIWRRTHAPAATAGRMPLSTQVPNTGLADIKKRVPFLASASSDLDDAFAKSSTDNSDDEAPADAEDGSVVSYLASLSRPSPRKAMGMVGYTPSASFDTSREAPYRTSTPIFDRGATPRPPPYSESASDVSDVSGVSDAAERQGGYREMGGLDEEEGRLIDALSTPRGLQRDLSDLSLDDAPDSPEEEDEEEDEEEAMNPYDDDSSGSIDPMLAWEMERRADEFFRTGLMGRCWDVWTQSANWIQMTESQIAKVRSHILLRQALVQWRRTHDRLLDMPNTADAHLRYHLQWAALSKWVSALKNRHLERKEEAWARERARRDVGGAWVRWRESLGARRTSRFLKDIGVREREFRANRDEGHVRASLQVWHDRTRERVGARTADARYEIRLLTEVFADWRASASQSRDLKRRLGEWDEERRIRLLGDTFGSWRQAMRLGQTEMGLAHMAERRLQHKAWQAWRLKSKQYKTADRFCQLATERLAFGRWQDRLTHHRMNERSAIALSQRQDLKLLEGVMRTWKIAERGELLLRVRTDRLRREVLDRWRGRLEDRAEQLERSDDFRTKHDEQVKKSTFALWRERSQTILARGELAKEKRESSLARSAFKKWRQSSHGIEASGAAADKARAFFLQRDVFRAWQISLAEARRDRWVGERRLRELTDVFHHWQNETVKSIERGRSLQALHNKRDLSLTRRAMSAWTDRIIEIKSRELDVKEHRDQGLVGDAFATWCDGAKRIREAQDLGSSFIEVSHHQSLKKIWRYWSSEAQKSRDRRTKLDQTLQDRDEALVVQCFETWLDKFRESKLAPVEEEVVMRQEDALMFKVWDEWVGRARVLPAVQFDRGRIRQMAWGRWRRAFELAIAAKAMERARDRELLAAVLAQWREAAAVKVASKPKRVRGRMRAHTPEQELRSSTSSMVAQGPSKARRSIGSPIIGGRASTASPTNTEPAYVRLRSELVRPRIASRGSPVLSQGEAEDAAQTRSPLVRALRVLPDR